MGHVRMTTAGLEDHDACDVCITNWAGAGDYPTDLQLVNENGDGIQLIVHVGHVSHGE